jgi:hypothetical protein
LLEEPIACQVGDQSQRRLGITRLGGFVRRVHFHPGVTVKQRQYTGACRKTQSSQHGLLHQHPRRIAHHRHPRRHALGDHCATANDQRHGMRRATPSGKLLFKSTGLGARPIVHLVGHHHAVHRVGLFGGETGPGGKGSVQHQSSPVGREKRNAFTINLFDSAQILINGIVQYFFKNIKRFGQIRKTSFKFKQ